jgi:excisionase family DNA binding protein
MQHERPILDARWAGKTTFTIPEVAEILGLSRWSAYAKAKSGDLPVVWIGHSGRVPRYALEQLLLNVGPRATPIPQLIA